jgi:hypothetical protein
MLHIPIIDSYIPFSIKALDYLYKKISFPQRAQIFEIFLPEDVEFPKKKPPYPSSIFSVKENQIISTLCYLLGYCSGEWVDEPILANNIHDQFFKFLTEGMFKYSSVLVYLYFFFQLDRFSCSLQKLDHEGNPQLVTLWTSLVRKNSTEFIFKDFIDKFYHPVVFMLNNITDPRINE